MYFSRVARVFEDAEVSRPDIERMVGLELNFRGGAESVSGMMPFTVDLERPMGSVTEGQGAGVSGATVNGLGCSQANVTTALPPPLPFPEDWTPPLVSPSLFRFKHSWEAFIDSLLREWKTLNVVSALLASCVSFFLPPLFVTKLKKITGLDTDNQKNVEPF
jgi:hypothetical protein